jgi:crotonobetainyl-CoA:carnitine CoA-transferase CaiB-like acyl-CoA transferase
MVGALSGFKVLDITAGLNGPCCGVWLSDYGAEVIKVEPRLTGEYGRSLIHVPDCDFTPYFVCANRGKKGITLDLATEKGREVVYRLVKRCDVLINNFRIGVLDRLGLGYDEVRKHNPRIIYATGSGYGVRGPMAKLPCNDYAAQAYGGLVSVTGFQDQPLPAGAAIADLAGSLSLTLGVAMALLARERFGEGQRVDASLYGAMMMLQTFPIDHYAMARELPEPLRVGRWDNMLPATYGMPKTKDGYIMVTWVAPEIWPEYCQVLGIPEITDDPRFDPRSASFTERAKYRSELADILDKAFQKKTTREWLDILRNLGGVLICSGISTYADIVKDPQAWENGYLIEMDIPGLGPTRLVGAPAMLSDTPATAQGMAPELGQNTEEVLLELGYSWEDITAMREQEVI